MGNYTESSAVCALKRIKGIDINATTKTIEISSFIAGNSTWGKIDFLTKYCGYNKRIADEKMKDAIDNVNEVLIQTPVVKEKIIKSKTKF